MPPPPPLRTVTATRYVEPLREGGSLPAIVEADDDGLYVVKFRGAGQGPRALVAELVAGEVGRALGLPVPELVFVQVDPALGRNERDGEIQALLQASEGINLALDYLPGSLTFRPDPRRPTDPALASAVVWFDAYVTNVDRTPRNTNILRWHRRLWLIDHGAALYFHHRPDWAAVPDLARTPFARVKDHVLLPEATAIPAADAALRPRLDARALAAILAQVPDAWLGARPEAGDLTRTPEPAGGTPGGPAAPDAARAAYVDYLLRRLDAADRFVEEAARARAALS